MCGNIIGCLISDKTIRGHYTDVGTLESTICSRHTFFWWWWSGRSMVVPLSYWEHLLIGIFRACVFKFLVI